MTLICGQLLTIITQPVIRDAYRKFDNNWLETFCVDTQLLEWQLSCLSKLLQCPDPADSKFTLTLDGPNSDSPIAKTSAGGCSDSISY
jgi:hypothetical protein